MKRTDPQMRIRIPPDVKTWVEQESKRNIRTQSAEIVIAIRDKMEMAKNADAMSENKTGRGSDGFMLRLPPGMRDRVRKVAAENRRSMNAQMIVFIEQALEQTEKG